MAAKPKPGKRGNAGRPKGSVNKTTKVMREMFIEAFENVGGVAYLEQVARDEPKAFLTVLGRMVPNAIEAKIEESKVVKVVDLSSKGEE